MTDDASQEGPSETAVARIPDGPSGFLGRFAFMGFVSDPLKFIQRFTERYPGAGRLPMFSTNFVYLTDPQAVKEVLIDREHNFTKDWTTRMAASVLGEGLLTSHGTHWKRQRRLIAPALGKSEISHYAACMVTRTEELVATFEAGRTRDVQPDMMRLTLEVVSECLLGRDVGDHVDEVAHALDQGIDSLELMMYTWRRMAPSWWPVKARRLLQDSSDRLDRVVAALLAQKRAGPTDSRDVMARLLAARDDDGTGMTDEALRDEVVTMLLAGHETTALVLTFALWLVATHPEIQDALVAESSALLAGREATASDMPGLRQHTAVIKETMRLYPPVWAFGREPVRDCEVAGYTLRAGDQVLMTPFAMHRKARWFPEPERFLPARWLEEMPDLPKHAYMPFGGGSRLCIGQHFAMLEAVMILCTLLSKWRFEAPEGASLKLNPTLTLRPKKGMPLRLHPR